MIFRIKKNEYSLFKEIKSEIESIEKLSGNRFLGITEEGSFIIYSLDIFSEYCSKNLENLCVENLHFSKIYNIKENQFIICTRIENKDNNKDKYLLKILYDKKELVEYRTNDENCFFSDFIVLKNKYFIIMINNDILILNILKMKIIKSYTILFYEDDNLFIFNDFKIIKWNNINDNEFILIIRDNFTLFELNDKYDLKILAYSYFPGINNIQKVDENNKFCLRRDVSIYFY